MAGGLSHGIATPDQFAGVAGGLSRLPGPEATESARNDAFYTNGL